MLTNEATQGCIVEYNLEQKEKGKSAKERKDDRRKQATKRKSKPRPRELLNLKEKEDVLTVMSPKLSY